MKLTISQLAEHLKKNIAPIYLLAGEEPLLIQEAQESIRQAARDAGFTERQSHIVNNHFNWQAWLNDAQALSLFSSKRLLELIFPTDKIDKLSQEALVSYCQQSSPDNILLITTGKLTTAQLNANWTKTIEKSGVIIQVWPITSEQLPQWIMQRAKKINLTLEQSAIKTLADYTEGNLLATQQTLEKLQLRYPDTKINAEHILEHINDNTRFDIFNLADTILAGDKKKALQILISLKECGEQPVLIIWALARELRILQTIHNKIAQGLSIELALTQTGVWEKRKNLFKTALRRLSNERLLSLFPEFAAIDRTIKGINPGNSWDLLATLLLKICHL